MCGILLEGIEEHSINAGGCGCFTQVKQGLEETSPDSKPKTPKTLYEDIQKS